MDLRKQLQLSVQSVDIILYLYIMDCPPEISKKLDQIRAEIIYQIENLLGPERQYSKQKN